MQKSDIRPDKPTFFVMVSGLMPDMESRIFGYQYRKREFFRY